MPAGCKRRMGCRSAPGSGAARVRRGRCSCCRAARNISKNMAARRATLPGAAMRQYRWIGGAKALPGESLALTEEAAKARGTAVHLLLEHLPQHPREHWHSTATALIPDADLAADTLDEARRLLTTPGLEWVFAENALAEVTFSAGIGTSLVFGTIDRLIIGKNEIHIIDFKSNSVTPTAPDQVPEGILRQMGAYVAAMRQVYPGYRVQPHILWTRSAQLMPLDPDIVSAALDRAAIP